MIRNRLLTVLFTGVLASCATAPQHPGGLPLAQMNALYEARSEKLSALQQWSMVGKLAISDGEDGGSGNLEWRHQPELSELDFWGAFGRGAWQLDIRPDISVLNFANGDTAEAPDVTSLVQNHVGWDIPVDALEWWVRGLRVPGADADYSFSVDETGTLNRLEQYDWTVEYLRYREYSGIEMPTRIEATRGDQKVKFVVRQWGFPGNPAHGS